MRIKSQARTSQSEGQKHVSRNDSWLNNGIFSERNHWVGVEQRMQSGWTDLPTSSIAAVLKCFHWSLLSYSVAPQQRPEQKNYLLHKKLSTNQMDRMGFIYQNHYFMSLFAHTWNYSFDFMHWFKAKRHEIMILIMILFLHTIFTTVSAFWLLQMLIFNSKFWKYCIIYFWVFFSHSFSTLYLLITFNLSKL